MAFGIYGIWQVLDVFFGPDYSFGHIFLTPTLSHIYQL